MLLFPGWAEAYITFISDYVEGTSHYVLLQGPFLALFHLYVLLCLLLLVFRFCKFPDQTQREPCKHLLLICSILF